MNDYTYQTDLSWKFVDTDDVTASANVIIYRSGYNVNLRVNSELYTEISGHTKGEQYLLIPNVPDFLRPNGTIKSNFTRLYTHSENDYKECEERLIVTISDNNLILSSDMSHYGIGTHLIYPINISYICTVAGPADLTSYPNCSIGPITPTVFCTYFLASRAETTSNSNISVSHLLPGTLVPFKTIRSNYSLSGSWSLGVDEATITVPISGVYQYVYTVTVRNSSNSIRSVSSCLRINDVISPGGGSTVKMDKNSISLLIGQQIVLLNANDQIKVYVISSDDDVVIAGTSSLFLTDNTSATIAITKIA